MFSGQSNGYWHLERPGARGWDPPPDRDESRHDPPPYNMATVRPASNILRADIGDAASNLFDLQKSVALSRINYRESCPPWGDPADTGGDHNAQLAILRLRSLKTRAVALIRVACPFGIQR